MWCQVHIGVSAFRAESTASSLSRLLELGRWSTRFLIPAVGKACSIDKLFTREEILQAKKDPDRCEFMVILHSLRGEIVHVVGRPAKSWGELTRRNSEGWGVFRNLFVLRAGARAEEALGARREGTIQEARERRGERERGSEEEIDRGTGGRKEGAMGEGDVEQERGRWKDAEGGRGRKGDRGRAFDGPLCGLGQSDSNNSDTTARHVGIELFELCPVPRWLFADSVNVPSCWGSWQGIEPGPSVARD